MVRLKKNRFGSYTFGRADQDLQEAMRSLVPGLMPEGGKRVTATLVREPSNPDDPDAVMILVDGKHVDYLSRTDALEFQPLLQTLEAKGEIAECGARVYGLEDERSVWKIRLDVARPSRAMPAHLNDASLGSRFQRLSTPAKLGVAGGLGCLTCWLMLICLLAFSAVVN